MQEIGGYFELELQNGMHYHHDAIRLNTARNCFEYILKAKKYTKVYIPYYTCDVMLEPLHKLNIAYEFYHINAHFEPLEDKELQSNEAFLFTNYFGLKQEAVKRLAHVYTNQLIVDNAQAFFAAPLQGIDTFYSARKFFGVPDGAYLYSDSRLEIEEQDVSYDRMAHLLKRIDLGASSGYSDFQKNDEQLIGQPIKKMSKLTENMMCSLDYTKIIKQRRANFIHLHAKLDAFNTFKLELEAEAVPMVYPFYGSEALRKKLIENKIYTATYWPNVKEWCTKDSLEYQLTSDVIYLPVDQRYTTDDMDVIVKHLL